MKLRFKHQKFQADAAKAIVDVFQGQPYQSSISYLIDKGVNNSNQQNLTDSLNDTGFKNAKVILDDAQVLNNIQQIQRANLIKPSASLFLICTSIARSKIIGFSSTIVVVAAIKSITTPIVFLYPNRYRNNRNNVSRLVLFEICSSCFVAFLAIHTHLYSVCETTSSVRATSSVTPIYSPYCA